MARNPDRRVQRTQQLLRGALLSLIQEKGFEALSVQDILDRANVGRATFYTHFDNKEDLLFSGFDGLRAALKERQREALSRRASMEERAFGFSRELLAHVNDHRDQFDAMVGKRSGTAVQNVLRRILTELVRDDLKAILPDKKISPAQMDVLVEFIAGGLFGMMLWWMRGKARVSVDDLDSEFRNLAIPVVKHCMSYR